MVHNRVIQKDNIHGNTDYRRTEQGVTEKEYTGRFRRTIYKVVENNNMQGCTG